MLSMPDCAWFNEHVANSLWSLTREDNWEKAGDVDVSDAIEAAGLLMESFTSMVGAIFAVAWADIPDSFLVCDGSVYERADYPALYGVLDNVFIVDADTFSVPDLSGRVAIGESSGFAIGEFGGEIEHTLDSGEMPSHSHTDLGHTHVEGNAIAAVAQIPVVPSPAAIPGVGVTGSGAANLTNTGGGNPHNNMQPYSTVRYVIAAR